MQQQSYNWQQEELFLVVLYELVEIIAAVLELCGFVILSCSLQSCEETLIWVTFLWCQIDQLS